jgi:hypothetical protein
MWRARWSSPTRTLSSSTPTKCVSKLIAPPRREPIARRSSHPLHPYFMKLCARRGHKTAIVADKPTRLYAFGMRINPHETPAVRLDISS